MLAYLLLVPGCAAHPKSASLEAEALVRGLRNEMVRFQGNYFGLWPEIVDDSARKVRSLGEAAMPLLVDAMSDPRRYIIAHVLLTRMSDEPYKVNAEHINGLHVSIFADGKVEYDRNDQPVLEAKWRAWLARRGAETTRPASVAEETAADRRNWILDRVLEGIFVEGVGEVAKYLPRIAEAAIISAEYHRVHGTWPRGRSDLVEFAEARGVDLDLSEFSDLRIQPIGDGQRARMTYIFHPHGIDGTLSGQIEIPQSER